VNLSPSAPRGLYRAVTGTPTRGAWVAACVSPEAAALGRARGYLWSGPCVGGVQPIVKPVVALAGDVVALGPEAVIVNGQRLPGSSSADVDSLGLPLPHAVWGRHVVTADEFWLVSRFPLPRRARQPRRRHRAGRGQRRTRCGGVVARAANRGGDGEEPPRRADGKSRSSHRGLPRISLVISRQSPEWRGSRRRGLLR